MGSEEYNKLPELLSAFESYTEKHDYKAWERVTDFMCTLCQYDKTSGSNRLSMSVEKLVTADDAFWSDFIQSKLKLELGSYEPLPRVQKERLLLDYIMWVVYVEIRNKEMPYYCCEMTPKIFRNAKIGYYRSEEELIEVYNHLYEELGIAEKSDDLLGSLLEFLNRNAEYLPKSLSSDIRHMYLKRTDHPLLVRYTQSNDANFTRGDLATILEDILKELSLYIVNGLTEDFITYVLMSCRADSFSPILITDYCLSKVYAWLGTQRDTTKRLADILIERVFRKSTQEKDYIMLSESIVKLGKLVFKGKKDWWRCYDSERIE